MNYSLSKQAKARKAVEIALFLMLFSPCVAHAADSSGDDYRMSFSFALQGTTIKDVFNYIERNSEYVFLYATEEGLSRTVNVNVTDKSVTQILDEVLEGTELSYEIDGKQILVKKAPIETTESVQQQAKKEVEGLVLDGNTGEIIIGATVRVKGGSAGVITDINGEFHISCAENDVLIISYIGYDTKEVTVTKQRLYTVELSESAMALGEVVVTAFGTGQKKESVVGSIQTVRPSDLRVPSSNLSNSFAGRLSGVIAYQSSGMPGENGANFYIRGISTLSGMTSPLIVMDGVEISSSDLNNIDPEIIESFSILKDATATAMYGTRGANGVMIIKTKSGQNLDKPIIGFRVEANVTQPVRTAKFVDGPAYMRMFNEAITNQQTGDELYSEEVIQLTQSGLYPYLYPNVDWYDEVFKDYAFNQKANFNIRGGTNKITYFMNLSMNHETGMLRNRSKEFYSYSNNINLYRFNFQNNIISVH